MLRSDFRSLRAITDGTRMLPVLSRTASTLVTLKWASVGAKDHQEQYKTETQSQCRAKRNFHLDPPRQSIHPPVYTIQILSAR